MARLRALAAGTILASLSLGLTAGIVEIVLRFAVDPEKLVPNAPTHISLNERRNELRFFSRHRGQAPDTLSTHDPWLGWDSRYGESRIRGHEHVPPKLGRRLVAVGDSFVYGNEVAAEENFVALLDQADNGLEALNLGVPGYGIDQSLLKLQRHGLALDPDIVLFGIFVPDYERATVRFTAAAKPRFERTNAGMRLGNVPVPTPAESLARIRQSLAGRLYVREFVASRIQALSDATDAFLRTGDGIAHHVLTELKRSTGDGRRLLVLHIPRGQEFVSPDSLHQAMSNHLRSLYEALAVPYVDLEQVFLACDPTQEIPRRFYVVRDSGSPGHLNARGHREAARAISRALGSSR